MPISLHGRLDTLSPPPLSELSDNECSISTDASAATTPIQSVASSRSSTTAPESSVPCCKWGCCVAVSSTFKLLEISGAQSFAVLNVLWVLCSAFCWVFHNKLCNFFFRCGCSWNWAGSWDRCVDLFCIFTM